MKHKPKTQVEIDLALHEYGQQQRKTWEKNNAAFLKNLQAFKDGVRDEWQREQSAGVSEPKIEAPKIEGPAIEGPRIEPPKAPGRDLEGPEPEV